MNARYSRHIRVSAIALLSVAVALVAAACVPAHATDKGNAATNRVAFTKAEDYAACMREHGFPKFPDPTPSQGPAGDPFSGSQPSQSRGMYISGAFFSLSGTDTSSPQFQKAQQTCSPSLGVNARRACVVRCPEHENEAGRPGLLNLHARPRPSHVPGPLVRDSAGDLKSARFHY